MEVNKKKTEYAEKFKFRKEFNCIGEQSYFECQIWIIESLHHESILFFLLFCEFLSRTER